MIPQADLKPYTADRFENRETEVELVIEVATRISGAVSSRPRTVVFRGEAGYGKTWLALHLKRTILPTLAGVKPLLISLLPAIPAGDISADEWCYSSGNTNEVLIDQLLRWVARQVGATTAPSASLRDLSGWLARDIALKYRVSGVLVLVLDSVFQADWKLLELLELYLLAPLANLPRVMIVLTGRGRTYNWESPYLRVETEEQDLSPFNVEQTRQQFRRQNITPRLSADKIIELGGGAPLNNVLLAQLPNEMAGLHAVVTALLENIKPEHRTLVTSAIEALCVLDEFGEAAIIPMLTERLHSEQQEEWTADQVSVARDILLDTRLMQWQKRRYVITPSARIPWENLLRLNNRDLWRRLRNLAYQLNIRWAVEFSQHRGFYQYQADRQANALKAEGFDIEISAELLAT